MPATLTDPITGHQAEATAFGSKMEAATEALLRVRDEIVATLDRQVVELQQIHRAFAYAPPPMTVSEDLPRPLTTELAPSQSSVAKPSLFNNAPQLPSAPALVIPVAPSPPVQLAPVVQIAQPTSPLRFQRPAHQVQVAAVATIEDVEMQFAEPTLDPVLERATLEELNDALASAFAMVSSRSEC